MKIYNQATTTIMAIDTLLMSLKKSPDKSGEIFRASREYIKELKRLQNRELMKIEPSDRVYLTPYHYGEDEEYKESEEI